MFSPLLIACSTPPPPKNKTKNRFVDVSLEAYSEMTNMVHPDDFAEGVSWESDVLKPTVGTVS